MANSSYVIDTNTQQARTIRLIGPHPFSGRAPEGRGFVSQSRIALYRLASAWPPADADYRSLQERGRPLRPPHTVEKVDAWTGLSCFDRADRARDVAEQFPGRPFVVRYDRPLEGPIRWRPTFGHGHITVWATKQELEPYLALDYREAV